MSADLVFATKAKYIGSSILPCPIEREITFSVFNHGIEMPELKASIPKDIINAIELIEKGSDLPSQTTVMCGIVGLVIDKHKPYIRIELNSQNKDTTDILLKIEDIATAKKVIEFFNNLGK